MPEFPRAHSKAALTTEQPRALRNDAMIEQEAGKRAKAISGGFDALQKTTMQWQKHVDKVQQDTAIYNYKLGAAEISNNAVMDTDITNEAEYQKQLMDLRKNVTKDISSEYVKNQIAAELNYMSRVAAIGIQKEFRTKTLKQGEAIAMADLDLLSQTPGNEDAIKARADKAVVDGIWDAAMGYKKQKAATEQMKDNWLVSTINTNPKLAKAMLRSNKFGFSAEKLDSAWKVYDRQIREVWTQTAHTLHKEKAAGTLTEDKVKMLMDQDKLDPKEGAAFIKGINQPVVPIRTFEEKTAMKDKLNAMRDALKKKELDYNWLPGASGMWNFGEWSEADFKKKADYRIAVLDAIRDGYITEKVAEEVFLTPEIDETFMNDPQFLKAQKQLNKLSDGYKTNEDKLIARSNLSSRIISLMKKGASADDALQIASVERIQYDFPEVNAENLLATAEEMGKPVWQVYKLRKR
jgi:hypothetical protein